jgi:hypothetical protein
MSSVLSLGYSSEIISVSGINLKSAQNVLEEMPGTFQVDCSRVLFSLCTEI